MAKKTVFHAPWLERRNGKVTAYCPECNQKLRTYMQAKCDNCGNDLYWGGKKGTEK